MSTDPISISFVANGSAGSAAGVRAQRIGGALGDRARTSYRYRGGGRLAAILAARKSLRDTKPDVTYVVDIAVAPILAWLAAGRPGRLVVDTGDAPADFIRLISRNRIKHIFADLLERVGYSSASEIVVRGPFHELDLRARGYHNVTVVPDGVDVGIFAETAERIEASRRLRQELGIAEAFIIGLQGHFTWYPGLGGGLGWDAVQALAELSDIPAHVVLIGDGPGVLKLRELAEELGVSDRLHTIGRVDISALPAYLGMCDVFLLTQTNDPSSWIRTTGKLPGYLAMGRPVLASRVGTASQLLPKEMLIEYYGHWDPSYPARLAATIRAWYGSSDFNLFRQQIAELAEEFDYDYIAAQAAEVALRASR